MKKTSNTNYQFTAFKVDLLFSIDFKNYSLSKKKKCFPIFYQKMQNDFLLWILENNHFHFAFSDTKSIVYWDKNWACYNHLKVKNTNRGTKKTSYNLVWVVSDKPKIFFVCWSERGNHFACFETKFMILLQKLSS